MTLIRNKPNIYPILLENTGVKVPYKFCSFITKQNLISASKDPKLMNLQEVLIVSEIEAFLIY